MESRRIMTMNWDGIEDLDDDDDLFFDASSSSEEEFEDSQVSFSATNSSRFSEFQMNDYEMWMATPKSITDRRRRLLQKMGLEVDKDIFGNSNIAPSTRIVSGKGGTPPPALVCDKTEKEASPMGMQQDEKVQGEAVSSCLEGSSLCRSRSDGSINTALVDMNMRKEEIIGSESKQRLERTASGFSSSFVDLSSLIKGQQRGSFVKKEKNDDYSDGTGTTDGRKESILLVKNVENGNEFMVKESKEEGNPNKLSDVETGKEITTEEFEKNAGQSPDVKELTGKADERKLKRGNSSFHKSFTKSKKKGAALFKNMRLGSIGGSNKERGSWISRSSSTNSNDPSSTSDQKPSSQWVKARVHGKSFKEFTALHRSQEIKGHEGSIWTMKFTFDARYLATAGEDKVIHIWEVQEFDVSAMRSADDSSSVSGTPVHPMAMVAGPDGRPPLPEATPEKKKKGKKKKAIPEYVHVPETVFGLSETPVCTLSGHLEDVLDLSWSRSRLLLSSSMDKTVRLWDIETKECLKLFSHTDYVTCIQINPADDDYFISGSLDSKVRIWNITDRHVTDWIDVHEMVTAVGYSNDGKVSVVGSHKGICRFYNTADCKLEFKEQIELKTKKKPQPKKITGFQFSTSNPSEVLVTSADNRVRILDGTKLVQKYKGYKNNNSNYSADFSADGKYIISASEDSQVYVWRHEESKAKRKYPIIKSCEHFPCKEVSVTAPWPGSNKLEQPLVEIHSKKHFKKSITKLPPLDDAGRSKRSSSPMPPLPNKGNPSTDNNDDVDHNGDASLGPCESFSTAAGSSGRLDDITSPSPSSMSSPGWGSIHGHKTIQATAWGFVIVTGGLGGEITVFQNVGMPFKVGRL